MNNHHPKSATVTAYLIGIVGAFLIMFVLVKAMQYYTRPEPVDLKRIEERRTKLAELRAADAQALTTYGWQDQAKEVIRLPIDRAMELTLDGYQEPTVFRSNLIERMEKATALPPPPPEQPSIYE